MSLFPELDGLPPKDLSARFASDPPCTDDPLERELWLQEVAVRMARRGEEGLDDLVRRIPGADHARLRAILLSFCFLPRTVVEKRFEELKDILLAYLGATDPLLIAEAIDGLNSLGMTDVMQEVLPFLHHESPYVVGSALRYLSRHDPEAAKPVLLESLKSKQPIVRSNAIDELDHLGCVEALPALRPLMRDEDKYVRQAAETAVANLE